jgi:hypothetical protein
MTWMRSGVFISGWVISHDAVFEAGLPVPGSIGDSSRPEKLIHRVEELDHRARVVAPKLRQFSMCADEHKPTSLTRTLDPSMNSDKALIAAGAPQRTRR